ncbi:MAG: hypothetical protein LBK25_03145 [Treponema sp.]|nr:hypothetical protein [Treponema sp.]
MSDAFGWCQTPRKKALTIRANFCAKISAKNLRKSIDINHHAVYTSL